MPKGPKGQKRPADVVGAAVMVAKLATGEMAEDVDDDGKNQAAVELGRKGGAARVIQEKNFKLMHYPAPAGLFFALIL